MKSTLRILVVLSLITLAVPMAAFQAVADHDGTREPHQVKCDKSYASISGVTADGVTLQTQVGSTSFELPRKLLQLAVSSTGSLEVTVKHECVLEYTLVADVTNSGGVTTTHVFNEAPKCVGGADTHSVPVGNDLATVHLTLKWIGCDGSSGSEERDIKVLDPAVPTFGLV